MSPLPGLELGKLDPEPSAITMKYPLHPGGGLLPQKLGGGVRPASQNPYPIYDLTKHSKPY